MCFLLASVERSGPRCEALRAANTELLKAVAAANCKVVQATARSTTLRKDLADAVVRASDAEAREQTAERKQRAAEAWAKKARGPRGGMTV